MNRLVNESSISLSLSVISLSSHLEVLPSLPVFVLSLLLYFDEVHKSGLNWRFYHCGHVSETFLYNYIIVNLKVPEFFCLYTLLQILYITSIVGQFSV